MILHNYGIANCKFFMNSKKYDSYTNYSTNVPKFTEKFVWYYYLQNACFMV